jgi:SAM-dependent methyltransferase
VVNLRPDFLSVTELTGTMVSHEQIIRLVNRYVWASEYATARDVVEVACGCGPGLGLLSGASKTLVAGDISEPILRLAREHYARRVDLRRFDALEMPFENGSKDVVILFEAIYYLPSADKFVSECRRVLRPGGKVLIATANKDLWDFHPSPFSRQYFGVAELRDLFQRHEFSSESFGYQRADAAPFRQRITRPLKRVAVASGLMPKTMSGKRWLKKLVFGREQPMPAEIDRKMAPYSAPTPIPTGIPDSVHKIIYHTATLVP